MKNLIFLVIALVLAVVATVLAFIFLVRKSAGRS